MIEVVPNSPEYFDFIRNLRNDERVKNGFIEQAHISREDHATYMAIHAAEYLIALWGGEPAGYVGSVGGDIRVCTHPDYQGRGVAKVMIEEIVKRFPGSFAKVKVENAASLKLFESVGFEPAFVILVPPGVGGSDNG